MFQRCARLQLVASMQVLPKPNRTAQRFYEGTKPVLFTQNIYAKEKTTETVRPKNTTDWVYIAFMISMHLLCFAAPFTFSWSNVGLFAATYFLTGCLGITLSFTGNLPTSHSGHPSGWSTSLHTVVLLQCKVTPRNGCQPTGASHAPAAAVYCIS